MKTLCIFGKASTAIEIAETAALVVPDFDVYLVIRNEEKPENDKMICDKDLPVLVDNREGEHRFIVPFADGDGRMSCTSFALGLGLVPMTIIHPTSIVSPSATVGEGCYIAPGAIISSNATLAPHSILNLNATFGHDAVAGEHLVVNPGAAISGNVLIGQRVLVGANSFIAAGLSIGDDCRIDALTYVGRDLEPNQLCTSRQMKVFARPKRDE